MSKVISRLLFMKKICGVPSFAFLSFLVGSRLCNFFFFSQKDNYSGQVAIVVEWNMAILGWARLNLARSKLRMLTILLANLSFSP